MAAHILIRLKRVKGVVFVNRFKYAWVQYCAHLGRNVVIAGCFDASGEKCLECLNKADCGYAECGCRNSLMRCATLRQDGGKTAAQA